MISQPISHDVHRVNEIDLHVATLGDGPPLILLHGWPEFWLTWEPVMRRLAGSFRLVAPDLRGFGDSTKPDATRMGQAGAVVHAEDILALMDALGMPKAGLVGHDVGAYVGQALARAAPDRLTGLFFFNCAYPGIGRRWASPAHLSEIWYQSFNQQPFAPDLVGADRRTCATYIGHFLRHWAARPDTFDDVVDVFVDNFMKPGALRGGFDWYISANAGRFAVITETAPRLPRITVPTCIRWGEHDPLMPYAWTDRLNETFATLDLAPFPAGHFPHREDPDRAALEIGAFFSR